jgi:uncharacterized protein (DUF433 family)
MGAKIINRGRGPEIQGTRITVYDVLDYARQRWHRDRIAALFRLSSQDIQAALDYIRQHQDEVSAHYDRIRERQGCIGKKGATYAACFRDVTNV